MVRIVSLIASATEIVHALGLGKFQVGRSHECDFPVSVRDLPVCTRPRFDVNGTSQQIDDRVKSTLATEATVYEVFPEIMDRLRPTHVITQTQCKVCAVTLEDVEKAMSRQHASHPKVVALEPNCLDDILRDILRIAQACGVYDRGKELIGEITSRMYEISDRVSQLESLRVACIEWTEPIMAAGNWIPQLIDWANGTDVFGKAGEHSPWIQFEQLAAADPDVIIIAPCGYDLSKTRSETHWLTSRPEWQEIEAVRSKRVYIADANQYITRPGPRIVESLQAFAEMIHDGQIEPKLRGIAWEPLE
jgi:iron complex transport system substrate-binding protein